MPFTGKATYTAGASLPEIAEDISDLVSLNAPVETPLLDAIGDASRQAQSTVHEWLEDGLLPNLDAVADTTIANPLTETAFDVAHIERFRAGDQIRLGTAGEIMLVTAIATSTNTITVQRGYGGTTPQAITNGAAIHILGNAALEGDDAAQARFTARVRRTNYTQIFSASAEVSGSQLAVRNIGVPHELNYQKQQRTRELLRDLENTVINGVAPATNPQGSAAVRRTMRGILSFITTNSFKPGAGDFPSDGVIGEPGINFALRSIWQNGNAQADIILVNAGQKRAINSLLFPMRSFSASDERYRSLVNLYETDFGVCRIVMSRWLPAGTIAFLDSSRIEVLPLAGRSFQYRPLAATGDRESGQVIGEYTLELRNENAHAVISGLTDL
ncbi:MAG: DUF5309 family protein [Tepidisphaeraceae bacterium]|jgi:hypothetical protein